MLSEYSELRSVSTAKRSGGTPITRISELRIARRSRSKYNELRGVSTTNYADKRIAN
jgi:hypothetical protein